MIKIRKYLVWFYMLSKRLLRQWSFLLLLCLIPMCTFFIHIAMTEESGVVHVLLCNEGEDSMAEEIITSLMNEKSVLRFSQCESEENAYQLIKKHKADVAWIFPKFFLDKMNRYTSGEDNEPFVKIIEREESMQNTIVREKLFGAIYRDYSRAIYENFSYSEIVNKEDVSPEKVRSYYDSLQRKGTIIQIERLNEMQQKKQTANYLTAPIRGILSLLIVLCSLAAAMYFLKEKNDGRFAWLSPKKRIIPAMASCFSATLLSGSAVLCALCLSGTWTGFLHELISMMLFMFATTGFCMTLSVFFRSPGKFGSLIPGLVIIMLVLSPIFFNLKVLPVARFMLPTHYYLYSVYNSSYYTFEIIYCVVVYGIGFLANYIFSERNDCRFTI